MKVGLLLPAEPEKAPYIQYYIDIFVAKNIEYDIIAWNRSGNNPKTFEHLVMYEKVSPDTLGNMKKIQGFWGFKKFIEKIVREKRYDYLVVHTITLAVFISSFLFRHYKKKYILDIRDECSLYEVMKLRLPILLKNAYCNVISSWGFKTWLPKTDYIISHNIGFRWKEKMEMPTPVPFFQHRLLNILTIGQIRHFEGNRILIDELANRDNIMMHFAGEGIDAPRLENYCKMYNIENVIFSGRYLKSDEIAYCKECDLVNILLPHTRVMQAMANRFYLAILNYKPVIVNMESIQAKYVKKYGLGVVWEQGTSLVKCIDEYIDNFDREDFNKGRRLFFHELMQDIENFETVVLELINRK